MSIEDAKKCLEILGCAYKSDYKNVDGRVIQSQLDNIIDVLNGHWSISSFCHAWDIHPQKKKLA